MSEAKRKPIDEDPKKSRDIPEIDPPDNQGGGDVPVDSPLYEESMPIDPPDNTGGGW